MPSHSEMTWKHQVAQNYFSKFELALDEKRIDFIVFPKGASTETPMLWAESKRENTDVTRMFAQLLLTVRPVLDKGQMPPKFLCAFDKEKIAFLEFHHIIPLFSLNDFDWTERPSNVSKKTENTIAKFVNEALVFHFKTDDKEIKEFIKTNFVIDLFGDSMEQIQVTRNNFLHVYIKWTEQVKPTIKTDFTRLKRDSAILDGDFFLADLLSEDKHHTSQFHSLYRDLFVVLQDYCYRITVDKFEGLLREVYFADNQKAHREFWKKYKRPPKEEFHELMKSRRDLLVPQTVRERQGAYFTPQIWVEKSQEYLEKVFGENWQEEYYIWDCCCGTGNLLAGLVNADNIWASTIDLPDVAVVHDMIVHGFNLLKPHVFQFDFLNDEIKPMSKGGKVPDSLFRIVSDPEKRKKLIVYMNPPYAEHGNKRTLRGTDEHKAKVTASKVRETYKNLLGAARRQIFALFFMRIIQELAGTKLASFSTLKYVTLGNFEHFRKSFKPKYCKGFISLSSMFDNVHGQFPIGFLIWDTDKKSNWNKVSCDIFDTKGQTQGQKVFHTYKGYEKITKWERELCSADDESIGVFHLGRHDFQNTRLVFIETIQTCDNFVGNITEKNLVPLSMALAVQHCLRQDWTRDTDQFLYPNDGWKKNKRFQNDCLIYTLFHSQNRVKSSDGINHWLPFKRAEVKAADSFASTFMADFLQTRGKFSKSATAVLESGKALWTYYHKTIQYHQTIKNDENALNDASLYEIREYFKGRKNGRLNTKSTDLKFNELDKALREAMHELAKEIQPYVYEYEFLLE